MQQQKNSLFEAFHADHALLGKGFHALSQCLRSGDVASAREIAERLDTEAGAHVAFEEEDFYPALLPLLGDAGVQKLYQEHELGLDVVCALQQAATATVMDESTRAQLQQKSEAMETHIAECGDLFAAMGRIPAEEQATLQQRLQQWRDIRPRWSEFTATRSTAR